MRACALAALMKEICCWLQFDCLPDSWPKCLFYFISCVLSWRALRHQPPQPGGEKSGAITEQMRGGLRCVFYIKDGFFGPVRFDTSGICGLIYKVFFYMHTLTHRWVSLTTLVCGFLNPDVCCSAIFILPYELLSTEKFRGSAIFIVYHMITFQFTIFKLQLSSILFNPSQHGQLLG